MEDPKKIVEMKHFDIGQSEDDYFQPQHFYNFNDNLAQGTQHYNWYVPAVKSAFYRRIDALQ